MAIKTFLFNDAKYQISYELQNSTIKKTILFLHGWGANKELMKSSFSNYFKDFCHVYIDLPGFGNSTLAKPLNSFEVKEIVNIFLKEIDKSADIVLGHSFGGKIATLLNPKNLVLLSSAGIVLQKKVSVKIKIKIFKCLKFFGLGRFYKLFASKDVENVSKNVYEMFKKVLNEDISDNFKNYKGKAVIFWGKEDSATPLIAGKTIDSLIQNSKFFELEGDHFFFLKNAKFIEEKTLLFKENL